MSLKNSVNKNCLLDSKKNSHLCCLSHFTGISCVWMLLEYWAKKIYPRKMAYCTSLPSFPFKLHRGVQSWQLEFSFSLLLISVLNFWMEPWLCLECRYCWTFKDNTAQCFPAHWSLCVPSASFVFNALRLPKLLNCFLYPALVMEKSAVNFNKNKCKASLSTVYLYSHYSIFGLLPWSLNRLIFLPLSLYLYTLLNL